MKKTEGELEKERILQIKLAQQKEFEEKDRKYKEEKKLSEALLRKEEELRKRILCKVKLKEVNFNKVCLFFFCFSFIFFILYLLYSFIYLVFFLPLK